MFIAYIQFLLSYYMMLHHLKIPLRIKDIFNPIVVLRDLHQIF